MFNLFPRKKSVDEILEDAGLPTKAWEWAPTQTPSMLQAQNNLIEQFLKENHDLKALQKGYIYERDAAREINAKLLKEKEELEALLKSIEEDGTEEHNNAIKLREQNAELQNSITRWSSLYQEVVDKNNELLKEVNGLRHLKKENVELMGRINEIDNDVIRDLKDEILVLKNDYAVLKAKHQIVQNNYKKCSEERDEYKHQLSAANKEIEILKRWKKEQLTVLSWWDRVDSYVRDHDDAPLGGFVANTCLNFLKERDELKTEVKKLKEDIIDYVIEKDDELKKAQDWNNLNKDRLAKRTEKYYVCNHCGYKVAHDTSYWGGCGFCKDGLMIEKEEKVQKHPMYPLHWGGYDGAASAYPEEYSKWLNEQKDKATAKKEKEKWQCPCNICKQPKEKTWEEAASDLALRLTKKEEFVIAQEARIKTLETKVEELTILNAQLCLKQP